jgi:hypothetical protein
MASVTIQGMKRITLTTLWFFAGWVIGAMAAFVLGISELVAPVSALAAAAVAYRPTSLERRMRLTRQSVPNRSH